MVFCAGYGTRLGDLTRETPKPMLPLAGRPLLEYILRHLAAHGFRDVVLNLHYLPELIRDHLGDGSAFGVRLRYWQEAALLGSAGGLRNAAADLVGAGPFLVQYGDVLTDHDFTSLLDFHRQHAGLATIMVHRRARSNSLVTLADDGRVTSFLERPTDEQRQGIESTWVFSGIAVCSPEFLELIPQGQACDLPRDVFPRLVAQGTLYAAPLSGFRCAVDSPERLAEAERAVSQGLFRKLD